MMSTETRIVVLKNQLRKKLIYDSDFEGYRTCGHVYASSKHRFVINWPKEERGVEQIIQIGVCDTRIVNEQRVVKDVWLWELPSKRLLRKEFVNDTFVDKSGSQQTQYPVGFEPRSADPDKDFWELPSSFGMVLDMDKGTLSFRINHREFGAAFKDELKGKALYLAFFAKKSKFRVTALELIPVRSKVLKF